MKYALDTNVVVRLLDADERVLRRLDDLEPSDIGIPMLVLAELWFGAEKSTRKEANRERLRQLMKQFFTLVVGPTVAQRYGVVRAGQAKHETDRE